MRWAGRPGAASRRAAKTAGPDRVSPGVCGSGCRIAVGAAFLGLLAACGGGEGTGETEPAADAPPDTVRIAEPGLHPEGVEWDAERSRFLVSSVTRGTVTAVEDDGTHRAFVQDPELSGSIGIHIDEPNGRLLVANSVVAAIGDTANPGQAKLGVYQLATGERVRMVDLGALRPEGRHFANDMTSAPDGTVYLTDSLSPVVYRVSPEGEASVLVEDERLAGPRVGLNGIEWHADGYLLAAVMGRSALVKIPLGAPGELTEVELPEPISADGLVLGPDGTLVAVGSTTGPDGQSRSEVLWLASSDGWASAEITARAPAGGATTGTLREGSVYVVNPHFEALGGAEPHPSFEIYRVEPAGAESGSGDGAGAGSRAG